MKYLYLFKDSKKRESKKDYYFKDTFVPGKMSNRLTKSEANFFKKVVESLGITVIEKEVKR